ncbi:FAS1-like dehydratase domain-containing protein [Acuticoccus mangrovi]|uniref:MaoC family dehydratase N-terminal domain-containing protein n=1 Tax=Acuticoccus mangrovi TaxID=2796142 RepID=A0A934ISU9_9HYPH|nr:MaoC family dehydratase N-terminal domain-containing protein [Acuticoccus mangrovi]MBJ3777998.1 MaoC family dehydratase N-terminal domain-containing protein [Acuticoccus mangrovi]
MTVDPSSFADWIGRRTVRTDRITDRTVAEFRATFDPLIAPVEATGDVPAGIFWCLSPDIAPAADLGRDGHPRVGIFMPNVGLPRRMWAGGEIAFHGAFAVGDQVERTSTVEDIKVKSGRTGTLVIVAVRHHYAVDGRLLVDERQDIVYREDPDPDAPAPTPPPAEPLTGAEGWSLTPDTTLLFRYSAMTFNGHRIHYDLPYARDVEGYPGLVVHGPIQATLMLNLAVQRLGALPSRFAYRGLSPLSAGTPITVEAALGADGTVTARVVSAAGIATAAATASR